MLSLLELAGIFIGIYFLYLYSKESPRPAQFLVSVGLVSVSSWMAEESCIRLYHFYEYHPNWHIFVSEVPLLVIIIWPVIITSALDLVSQFDYAVHWQKILTGAAIVATDALFIEPLSASAGLWQWRFPGIFGVPPVGILGWFFFAFLVMLLLKNDRLQERRLSFSLLLLFFPVIGTHLLLLLIWWGALRWINFPLNPLAVAIVFWGMSLLGVAVILKKRCGLRVKKKTLWIRIPAAVFFFSLILQSAHASPLLSAYALAFVPPYVMLMLQQYRNAPDRIR